MLTPDPASALVKLRLFAENLTKDIYQGLALPKPEQATLVDLLNNHSFAAITPKVILDKLHALRIHGNKAAHGEPAYSKECSLATSGGIRPLALVVSPFGKGNATGFPLFSTTAARRHATTAKGQLKREKRQSVGATSWPKKRKWKCSCRI